MAMLIGRYITATKNADGTVFMEMAKGTPQSSTERFTITLSAADATALNGVLTGVTGTTSTVKHASENNAGHDDK